MKIFMEGFSEKKFAPDLIQASVTFKYNASTYNEALRGGVEKVKNYINGITDATDFTADDFKTRAYLVEEHTYTNRLNPKTKADLDKNLQKTISEGFFFSQYAYIKFDYNKERLAKLLAISSKIPGAPMLHVNFKLKDIRAKERELIQQAYEDAKMKAEAIAKVANKNSLNCIRVEIDRVSPNMMNNPIMGAPRFESPVPIDSFEREIKNIDETFKPDDITLSKTIDCVWEIND